MNFIYKKLASIIVNLNDERHRNGLRAAFAYICKRIKYYVSSTLNFILTLPIAMLIIGMRPFLEIQFVMLLSSRIGHFSANAEFMLLDQLKNLYKKKKLYLFYQETMVCNKQLSKMWKRILPVVPFPRLCRKLDKTLGILLGDIYRKDSVKAFENCARGRDHHQLLEKRDMPYLYFTPREINKAEMLLSKMGLQKNQRFVCILVRDAGYLDHRAPGKNLFKYHDCRDADIDNYHEAALFLAKKGYMVFRMGKHVIKPFNVNHPNIIDFANHPERCDLLDIYLAAHCQFIISTSTGLDCISQLFKKPVLFTDLFPILRQLQFWYPCLLFIPKKIRYRDTKQVLSFKELEKEFSNIIDVTIQRMLDEKNTEIAPNTSQEILDAVIEMEARVNHTWVETDEDRYLQQMLLEKSFPSTIFNEELRYESDRIKVKMGSRFIQENKILLGLKANKECNEKLEKLTL